MKKVYLLFTAVFLALSLVACSGEVAQQVQVVATENADQINAAATEVVAAATANADQINAAATEVVAAATANADQVNAAATEVVAAATANADQINAAATQAAEAVATAVPQEEEAEPTAVPATEDTSDMSDIEALFGGDACDVDLTGEEIVIYQQAGREGPLATILGNGFAYATEDAVNIINANGGICGATVRVEFGETNYAVEQEIAVYERFRVADPKPVFLLSYGSGATVALKDRVVEDEIVHLVAGLEAGAIYDPVSGYTVAAAPIYSDQFAGFLEWLSQNWDEYKPEGAGDDIVVGVIGWPNAFGAGATTPEAIAYAESLGITVLPLEQVALAPDADVSGAIQNLVLSGANVLWNQSLSFTPAQVVGATHQLGLWQNVVMSGVNWAMHNDVPNYLGANQALIDGFVGPLPYAYWSDTDVPGVQLAMMAFEEAGRPESDRSTTYLTTFAQFLAIRNAYIHAINQQGGLEGVTGATMLQAMQDMGEVDGGGISYYVVGETDRSPRTTSIRRVTWDGEKVIYETIADEIELPDTRPTVE
jgi:branched-chain amino acid transport system substrate-binding protein